MSHKKSIAIIGGGASALSLACFLNEDIFDVTIYEKNKALGRKFLVAGKGGFNLTHSESISDMILKYSPVGVLDEALLGFDNEKFRGWLSSLDIPTYVGSSRRVFPEIGIKPIEVLTKIKNTILAKGHKIVYNWAWKGWSIDYKYVLSNDDKIDADIIVYCLGGGSWKVTGSDGKWTTEFKNKEIKVNQFEAANCAYQVDWNPGFIKKTAGKPLKNIAISCLGNKVLGEAMITDFGLEGSAVYALTNPIQSQLSTIGTASVELDLKPMLSINEIYDRLSSSKKNVTDTLLKDLKLEKIKIQLLKSEITKDEFLDTDQLAGYIKGLPVKLHKSAPIDEAISTTGGIDISEIDKYFQLKKMPNNYVIGEMLNWNAPTGGYLLQACFSMGHYLATHLNDKY